MVEDLDDVVGGAINGTVVTRPGIPLSTAVLGGTKSAFRRMNARRTQSGGIYALQALRMGGNRIRRHASQKYYFLHFKF
jgi:hypothetical protein